MTDTPKHASLVEALGAFQAEAPKLFKGSTVKVKTQKGEYSYKYIALDDVMTIIQPLLTKHGLVFSSSPSFGPTGSGPAPAALDYRLMHVGGQEIVGSMPLMEKGSDPQALGGAITYMRRYALTAVLNLVADDDTDAVRPTPARQSSVPDAPKREPLATEAQQKHLLDLSDELVLSAADLADAICHAMAKPTREFKTFDAAYAWCNAALPRLPAKMVGVVETKLRRMVGEKEAVAS